MNPDPLAEANTMTARRLRLDAVRLAFDMHTHDGVDSRGRSVMDTARTIIELMEN